MPELLGHYRLERLLATGGMGEVWLARDVETPGAPQVVVKRLLRHLARDQGFVDLFRNEAHLARPLRHPNIVRVFDFGEDAGRSFIAMEYVPGHSLRGVLTEAAEKGLVVPPRLAVHLVAQVLRGLDFAHHLVDDSGRPLGLVHGDVTPENVLVAHTGEVKLADFGVARALASVTPSRGRPQGKVAYLAPEVLAAGGGDARADVYAAGVLLYEVLTLALPGNVPGSVEEALGPRSAYQPQARLPPALDAVLERAMAPEPGARFDGAADMAGALEAWLVEQRPVVRQADVEAFLVGLFGPRGEPDDEAALGAETPLTAQLRVPLAAMAAETGAAPEVSGAWRQAWVAVAVGAGTLLTVGFITLMAVWPQPEPEFPAVPLTEAGPHDRVMPPLVLLPLEASPRADEPPTAPEVQPADAPPAKVKKRRRRAPARVGRVTLRVQAGTEVFYRGKSYGVTPLPPLEVPSGRAIFTLRNQASGVTRRVSVRVPAGGRVVLRADLSKR